MACHFLKKKWKNANQTKMFLWSLTSLGILLAISHFYFIINKSTEYLSLNPGHILWIHKTMKFHVHSCWYILFFLNIFVIRNDLAFHFNDLSGKVSDSWLSIFLFCSSQGIATSGNVYIFLWNIGSNCLYCLFIFFKLQHNSFLKNSLFLFFLHLCFACVYICMRV